LFKFLGNKRLLILLLFLIVFVVLMGLTFVDREKLNWPERFIKDSVSWTQEMFNKPVNLVASWITDIHNLQITYQENNVLRARLSQYAITTMELNLSQSENGELKKLLDFTERQKQADQYTYRVAEIVAVSSDPYNNVLNINLGSDDGMAPNMAVVSADGLIGRITRVANHYSTVQLIIDIDDQNASTTPNSKAISATIAGNENLSFGIIASTETNPDHPQQKLLVMTKIDPSDPMKVGDTVITSGEGQVFPKGIVIGKVISRQTGDYGIDDKALVQPAANFNHLNYVMIVQVPNAG